MEFFYYLIKNNSNYRLKNINNIYNCLIDLYDNFDGEDDKQKINKSIVKNIGVSFFNDFKAYCIRKNIDIF